MFSNYLIAIPIPDKSANTIVKAYVNLIQTKHGSSEWIISDNAQEFKSKLFQEVCDKLNSEHRYSTVYYPKGNARVENVHNFLKRVIAKYKDPYEELDWDAALQLACFAFNSSESTDGLQSPFFLIHGRHPREKQFEDLKISDRYLGDNEGLIRLKTLKKIWADHAKHLRKFRLQKAGRVDKSRDPLPKFKQGDKVLLRNFIRGPFDPKFELGYTVLEQIRPNVVKISKGARTWKVNVHHIKRAAPNQSRDPSKHDQNLPEHGYNLRSKRKEKLS